ncbi:hypothetical protein [Mycolicibacterium monacense]|uniref:Uncharacterized protein n=2 Tax=unclassified Mycobacterium TaxID=2642494 RepID=A0A5Q5BN96_MYCSS|nr:hypothetical protein [Mycolicibacterium monacense]OBF49250.1 hypothetical protein A5778_20965 [Mycolicibacterium monacense]
MIKQIELRLVDGSAPSGEITLKDLSGIAAALQELVTRLSREAADAAGPGRSKQYVEEFAELRLDGITAGSTVLKVSKGPTDKLDVDVPGLTEADDRLWDILGAISADHRPAWTSTLVAESVGKLATALRGAAPTTVISSPDRGEVRIDAARIHPETWAVNRVTAAGSGTAAGWLEKVDLHSHTFRIRDDVGNTVELRRVADDKAAGRLVGQWVTAEGDATLSPSGRVVALNHARVRETGDPAAEFLGSRVVPLDEILASAPGPDPNGGIDLTDEEAAEFLRAIRS